MVIENAFNMVSYAGQTHILNYVQYSLGIEESNLFPHGQNVMCDLHTDTQYVVNQQLIEFN